MRKKKSDKAKSEERPMTLGEALLKHKPLSEKEADDIVKKLIAFHDRLNKLYGKERMELYTSHITAIAYPDGIITNLRGNMHAATFAMAHALNLLVKESAAALRLTRESVLLTCITDLAEEIRKLWLNDSISLPPFSDGKPSTGGTKVPIKPVE